MRMTIRPEPRVFTVEDVAAIIATRYYFVADPNPWIEQDEQTYQETWQKIMEENPSRKEMMRILTDCWYIANYEEWTDSSLRIDTDLESHQAMVDFILMKFPKFRQEDA
jgi:hypothetical protein